MGKKIDCWKFDSLKNLLHLIDLSFKVNSDFSLILWQFLSLTRDL